MNIELLQTTMMPATSIRIMADILRSEGFDPDEALREAGLPPRVLTDPLAQVNGIEELAFQRIMHERTADRPDLWFAAGMRYRIMGYGVGGLFAMTSANLSQMVVESHSWAPLVFTLAQIRPILLNGVAVGMEFDLSEVPELLREFTVHRDMGASIIAFADMVPEFRHARITMAFPRPEGPLGPVMAAAAYDAERTAMLWSEGVALRPFLHADPTLHAGYRRQCAEVIAQIQQTSSFLKSVLRVLGDPREPHTIASTAKALGMSKRTLQRRLQDHSMSFHDVLGTVKVRVAKEMLLQSGAPISEVAWSVGYADTTGFSHAFRRWTGLSPRAFRTQSDPLPGEVWAELPPAGNNPAHAVT